MSKINERLQRAMNDLAGVQLIDNTWQEAEVVRREITGIIQTLHRDLCAEASSARQEWDVKCQELERRLAEAEVLVPDTELMKRAAGMMWHTCESCPTLKIRCPGYRGDRRRGLCNTLTKKLMRLAADIRAWRGDGDGEGGEDGKDNRD